MLGDGLNEGDGEERDRFLNDMNRTLDGVANGYRLCILGDLNGWIGGRGLCVGNTYFFHRSTQEWRGVETVCRLSA